MAVSPQYRSSARRGLTSWLVQRLTSLYIAAFVLVLLVRFAIVPVKDFTGWHAWWSRPSLRFALALFIVSVLLHSWIGMRSVYLDYVKPWWLRLLVSVATAFALALIALWSARLLFVVGA